MKEDEIVRMAVVCQLLTAGNRDGIYADALIKFANLVAAKKQERIIEVVERLGTWAHITEVVAEIRGEA